MVADIERDIPIPPSVPKPKVRIEPAPAKPVSSPPPSARKAKASPVAERVAQVAPAVPEPEPAPAGPSVRVLSGASQGRHVPFPGPELTVGRVGMQVAVVRKVASGYVLIPLEGKEAPRINGAPVTHEGSPLHPGDTFEVAGVRLELSVDS
jgi:hypothetical protein